MKWLVKVILCKKGNNMDCIKSLEKNHNDLAIKIARIIWLDNHGKRRRYIDLSDGAAIGFIGAIIQEALDRTISQELYKYKHLYNDIFYDLGNVCKYIEDGDYQSARLSIREIQKQAILKKTKMKGK
jgi:hypothetical protein